MTILRNYFAHYFTRCSIDDPTFENTKRKRRIRSYKSERRFYVHTGKTMRNNTTVCYVRSIVPALLRDSCVSIFVFPLYSSLAIRLLCKKKEMERYNAHALHDCRDRRFKIRALKSLFIQ